MHANLLERAKRYRMEAEEARKAAENRQRQESRETFQRVADLYDLLAEVIEQRAARLTSSDPSSIARSTL
jgi:hypothetical protein